MKRALIVLAAVVLADRRRARRCTASTRSTKAETCAARRRSSSSRRRPSPRRSCRRRSSGRPTATTPRATARRRAFRTGSGPPFGVRWYFRGRALVEFPPTIAYGRLYFANAEREAVRGRHEAATARSGSAGRGAAPRRHRRSHNLHRLHDVPEQAALQRRGRRSGRRDGRAGRRTGKVRWWRGWARPSPRRSWSASSSTPATGAARSMRSARKRAARLDATSTGDKVKDGSPTPASSSTLGSDDHHVYALNARTGTLVWKTSAQARLGGSGTFYSTPAAAYDRVYIGSTDSKVYSLCGAPGKLRWSHGDRRLRLRLPRLSGNKRVYVGSYDTLLLLLRRRHGRRPLAPQGERSDLRLRGCDQRRRLLLELQGPHLRGRRAHRQAALVLPAVEVRRRS